MAESAVVAELIAKLGFSLDKGTLAAAETGLEALNVLATQAVAAVESITLAFKAMAESAGLAGAAAGGAMAAAGGGAAAAESHAASGAAEGAAVAAASHAPGAAHAPAKGGHGGPHGTGAKGLSGLFASSTHVIHGFLGLFAAHELLHFSHELTDLGVNLELTSQKLGISKDAVQQLQYAASLKSIDKSQLGVGLRFLQVNAVKAAAGTKASAAAFAALGVKAKGADGKIRPVDELFGDVAEGLTKITDPAKQTAIAVQLFGRSGQTLLPLLKEGKKGLEEFKEEAIALGGGLDETFVENAEKYEHATKQFEFAFLGVKNVIGNFLLPIMTKLAQGFTYLVGKFTEIRKHTKLWETAIAVGLVVALGKAVMWMRALGWAATWAWIKSVAGFLLMAAVIAGVVIVLEDLYQTMTGGKGMIGLWLDEWKGLGSTSEFLKTMAAGLETIKQTLTDFMSAPVTKTLAALSSLGGFIKHSYSEGPKKKWLTDKDGSITGTPGEKYWVPDDSDNVIDKANAGMDERANRPIANGRGVNASARGSIDIPRATERGLFGKATQAFGQGSAGGVLGSGSSDSVPTVIVNVKSEASAHEIGHHVKKALAEHEEKRVDKLHHDLVPELSDEEAEPTE